MNAIFRLSKCGSVVLFCVLLALSNVHALQNRVEYTVAVSPEDHLLTVRIQLPRGAAERDLQLPVWYALYQIRDFSQYVSGLWVTGSSPEVNIVSSEQVAHSSWRLQNCQFGAMVTYQVYADSPGPFGAQLNADHAFLNLAEILMYTPDTRNLPVTLRFAKLPGWKVATPLPYDGITIRAENYDRLVDSPVEIGEFQEVDFDEAGAHFRVIIDADPADYDAGRIISALHKIVSAGISWMDDRPFDTYTFFYHFPHGQAGGGMEHAYSTAIELNAESIKNNLYPLTATTAHEFFHLWNVKRIRPQTLEPIDYTKENYTRALWFSEGVTSTAEEIIQLRAGLIDEKLFLTQLGDEITELERRPAHVTQSAEESSLDAWLEGFSYYRRPERSISYYNKGELLGIMLDLAIRDSSHGKASLRELLQWMNANYAKQHRFFNDANAVREAAEAVSHADFGAFFNKYVAGTEEIPWNDFLRSVGLRVQVMTQDVADPGFLASRNFDGPMSVLVVTPGSNAERAGLQVGDTIDELHGKVPTEESRQQLSQLKPGDSVEVRARSRRGGDRELKWKVGARQEVMYEVKNLDQVTPEQRARRAAWLRGEAQNSSEATSR